MLLCILYVRVIYSICLTVVVVGFVDTLVEVNETDGQATLNVSISSPQPDPALRFEIIFSLNVGSVEGSAGMNDISQCSYSNLSKVLPWEMNLSDSFKKGG